MSEQPMSVWVALAFPFFFVGLWVLICQVLGRLGGWLRLAEVYGTPGFDVQGRRFRLRSGSFGWVGYNNVLTFEAGPRGLAFSVPLLFRVGHPPFAVPWSDIELRAGTRWRVPVVELRFVRCPEVRVAVTRRLAEQITAAAGVSHRLPIRA